MRIVAVNSDFALLKSDPRITARIRIKIGRGALELSVSKFHTRKSQNELKLRGRNGLNRKAGAFL